MSEYSLTFRGAFPNGSDQPGSEPESGQIFYYVRFNNEPILLILEPNLVKFNQILSEIHV